MQTKEMKTEPFTLDPELKAKASSSLAPDATNGDKVRALRLAQGLSLAELARRTGLTSRAIRYMENNERTPSVDAVRRLSAALGVTTDYFMDNETFRRELQDDAFYTKVRQKYGSRGVAQARKIQQQTAALFAGGELSGEDQLAFIEEMEEVFLIAKEEAKKYTPKKYQN
ncbi:MAG: helix-turn-helix domain-containing protein [Lachnospiraceae bacterium]|nr:helix-turn-helix domain-containing protein [Lachnospiraceae bacterium]